MPLCFMPLQNFLCHAFYATANFRNFYATLFYATLNISEFQMNMQNSARYIDIFVY